MNTFIPILVNNPFYLEDTSENLSEEAWKTLEKDYFLLAMEKFYIVSKEQCGKGKLLAIAFSKATAKEACYDKDENRIAYYSLVKNKLHESKNQSITDQRVRKTELLSKKNTERINIKKI